MKKLGREFKIGIVGYMLILVASLPGALLVNHLMTNKATIATVLMVGAIMFVVGPVTEELAKMLALQRFGTRYFPLILGVIEFAQYVLLMGVNPFLRVPVIAMHYLTGEIHRSYRNSPIGGLLLAIVAHQGYNMATGLLAFMYIKFVM